MRPNPLAPWELRMGHLCVYYEVVDNVVTVRAIGIKARSRVRIGRQWWEPGKPWMSIENADLETVSLSTDARFIAMIEPGSGIPLEEIRRKYGHKPKTGGKTRRSR